jgi:hypothetical protein
MSDTEVSKQTCGQCHIDRTPEGHDGCLGTLPGNIMNACCGHKGHAEGAYIQYGEVGEDGRWIQTGWIGGDEALEEFKRLGRGPDSNRKNKDGN